MFCIPETGSRMAYCTSRLHCVPLCVSINKRPLPNNSVEVKSARGRDIGADHVTAVITRHQLVLLWGSGAGGCVWEVLTGRLGNAAPSPLHRHHATYSWVQGLVT